MQIGNEPEVGVHVLGVFCAELRVLQVLLVDVNHTSRQAPDTFEMISYSIEMKRDTNLSVAWSPWPSDTTSEVSFFVAAACLVVTLASTRATFRGMFCCLVMSPKIFLKPVLVAMMVLKVKWSSFAGNYRTELKHRIKFHLVLNVVAIGGEGVVL